MPKVKLTEELSKAIKNTRNDKGVHAADLAQHLEKSVAFISKLENNKAEYVEFEVLLSIFRFLLGSKEEFEAYIQPLLEKSTMELTEKEIEKQEWIQVFDLQIRQIPIPTSLISFLSEKISEIAVSQEEVIEKMNRNEELDIDTDELESKPTNVLIFDRKRQEGYSYIVFEQKKSLLTDLLEGKIQTINYILMEGIIRTIYKMDGHSPESAATIAVSTLNSHKFYSLYEKKKLLRGNQRGVELNALLSEHDKQNIQSVNAIIRHIKILSDWNVDYANRKLKNLEESFKIDPSFILAVIGSEFFKLSSLDKDERKAFLTDLAVLIDRYSDKPAVSKEKYEEY